MVYFQTKDPKFGYILEGLEMENVGIFNGFLDNIFYGHLVYLMGHWVYFPNFGLCCQEKSGNPGVAGEAELTYISRLKVRFCRIEKASKKHCRLSKTR
jgi:hypothetical protein